MIGLFGLEQPEPVARLGYCLIAGVGAGCSASGGNAHRLAMGVHRRHRYVSAAAPADAQPGLLARVGEGCAHPRDSIADQLG
jgi:hypothetical protein